MISLLSKYEQDAGMPWSHAWTAVASITMALLALVAPVAAQKDAGRPEPPAAETSEALTAEFMRLFNSGKYAEAIPLAQQLLAGREESLGSDHPDLAPPLNNLALLYSKVGRYAEAEFLFNRSLTIREKARRPDDPDVALALNNLAELYRVLGRYREAEMYFNRSRAINEKLHGYEHPNVAAVLNNLAALYQAQGRYEEARPLLMRALEIQEKVLGPNDISVARSLNNLAWQHWTLGRYADAEPLLKRSLTIREKAFGPEHPDVARALNNLAELYKAQNRFDETELLFKRALDIDEKILGAGHLDVAVDINNLAGLYLEQKQFEKAEPLYKRSLSIRENVLGPQHSDVAAALNNLAQLYKEQRRYDEAEPLFERAVSINEKALGSDHPDVATALSNLALLHDVQGRATEAERLFNRSLNIREKVLGPNHLLVASSLSNLAWLALARGNWPLAAGYWGRAAAVMQYRTEHGLGGASRGSTNAQPRGGHYFEGLVKVTHRQSVPDTYELARRSRDMFETAQWARASVAASSLAQMAARSAGGSPGLAALIRERQDLVAEWQVKDKLLIAAKSELPAKRNQGREKELDLRLADIDARLAAIDVHLAKDFPNYTALANPKPIAAADVQSALRDDEALVLYLDTVGFKPLPGETFIWVITNTKARWVRSELGTDALQERVAALRCGLDRAGEWVWSEEKYRWVARKPACDALRPEGLAMREPLPFNPAIAHELYERLFGDVKDLIKGKHLLIVASGALTSLPFQVLVTKPPVPGQDYRSLAWLARDHALTVLPSAASLIALRRVAKTSSAAEPFIGFGNPVLAGRCDPVKIPKACPDEDNEQTEAQAVATRSSGILGAAPEYFRDGLADVAALRRACPLPDTAHELKCVARSLGAPPSSLVLGKDMTETALKKMPLDHYRVVHFATHGLLAGETERFTKTRAEPALLFTPPDNATEEDDGLLTASEIAGLKLDADWVVMSACNTAGGEKPGAEALSGLAKAFFYAGARALLVSHWPVNTNAATLMTSRTFAELRSDKSIGRAEAFRRAMLALINDKQRPWAAHPSVWAPFVVVGEGGVAR